MLQLLGQPCGSAQLEGSGTEERRICTEAAARAGCLLSKPFTSRVRCNGPRLVGRRRTWQHRVHRSTVRCRLHRFVRWVLSKFRWEFHLGPGADAEGNTG